MKFANTMKTLCIVGLTTLGLSAGTGHADFDGFGQRGYQNPYMPTPEVRHPQGFRQQIGQFELRMDQHLQRILYGMESGRLTMREAVGLLREHQAINALERQYLADGRLGPRELFDLDRRLDQASRNIAMEMRDSERLGYNRHHDEWPR
jgi:hypothetical protein